VTEHTPTNKFRLIFAITALLLLCGGLQSAFACLLPENSSRMSSIRVDSCHLVISQKESNPCCQIETCHQSALPQRDLDSPGYHALHKDSYSLAHQSRSQTPQLKAGDPFVSQPTVLAHFSPPQRESHKPLQSLYSLRTVVLLN